MHKVMLHVIPLYPQYTVIRYIPVIHEQWSHSSFFFIKIIQLILVKPLRSLASLENQHSSLPHYQKRCLFRVVSLSSQNWGSKLQYFCNYPTGGVSFILVDLMRVSFVISSCGYRSYCNIIELCMWFTCCCTSGMCWGVITSCLPPNMVLPLRACCSVCCTDFWYLIISAILECYIVGKKTTVEEQLSSGLQPWVTCQTGVSTLRENKLI